MCRILHAGVPFDICIQVNALVYLHRKLIFPQVHVMVPCGRLAKLLKRMLMDKSFTHVCAYMCERDVCTMHVSMRT